MGGSLTAGAASVDITPGWPQFLYGYPHVERRSRGVHDPLLSSALYLSDGRTEIILTTSDVIYVSKAITGAVRQRIAAATAVPPGNIMVCATHTHSGPVTVRCAIDEGGGVVPEPDPRYVRLLEDGIVEAAIQARRTARPARLGLAIADDTGIGTNRHDPAGPADHQAPVLLVRPAEGEGHIGCVLVCSMHPTVLHEDSRLVSADFPGMARALLRKELLGGNCPVLHCTGPAGNQSPRHVTKANTFEEAERIGGILGKAVARAVAGMDFSSQVGLRCVRGFVDLPRRELPSMAQAEANLNRAWRRLEHLRQTAAPRPEIRTAECDLFGAEETVTLARAAASGRIEESYAACLPAEVQAIAVGPWRFVAWPGEVFVEYGLAVRAKFPDAFVITCANGDLQSYVVTEEAVAQGFYEAGNALFSPRAGEMLVEETSSLLAGLPE